MALLSDPSAPASGGEAVSGPHDGQDRLGPVELLVIEFPSGRIGASGFSTLTGLVDRRIITVLDLEFVRREADGSVVVIDVEEAVVGDLTELSDLGGASSGLLDAEDLEAVGEAIQPGSLAGVLVYEQVWQLPVVDALERSGARVVTAAHVDPAAVVAALEQDGQPSGTKE